MLPWDNFGCFDCSIEQIAVHFSGPRGDYEGATQRPEYPDAQQAFYTGYCKYRGIEIELVFTPDSLGHIFESLSARPADVSAL